MRVAAALHNDAGLASGPGATSRLFPSQPGPEIIGGHHEVGMGCYLG